jgi:hypothetical protein
MLGPGTVGSTAITFWFKLEGQSDLEEPSPVNACGAILELFPVLLIPLLGASLRSRLRPHGYR